MKRIISSVLILALLCCMNNISFAEEIEDSLNISEEELEILQPLEGYPVYKIYREEIMLFFGKQIPISELTTVCTEYLYRLNGGNGYSEIKDGKVKGTSTEFLWCEWDQYVVSPEVILGPEVEVYHTYCFADFDMYDPVCIYYVTNKGDFALVHEFMTTDDIHLFPADVFYRFMAEVYELQMAHQEGSGRYTILDIAGVEEYVLDLEPDKAGDDQTTVPPTEVENNSVLPTEKDNNAGQNVLNNQDDAALDWAVPTAICVAIILIVGVAIVIYTTKHRKSE